MPAEFEMDGHGNFRIVVGGQASEWTMYEHIAVVQVANRWYLGVSDYYGGDLPTETVLLAQRVPTTTIHLMLCEVCGREERVSDPDEVKRWEPTRAAHNASFQWTCPDHPRRYEETGEYRYAVRTA